MTEGELENVVVDCRSTASRCFYCHNTWQFHVHGMTVSCMNVHTYQDLVDIGWTRSGFYIYKPILNKMCCPAYTHRLNVDAFKISRSQHKALKKWRRYLDGGAMIGTEERSSSQLDGRHQRNRRCKDAPYQGLFRVLLREVIERWFCINDYDQVEMDVDIRRPSTSLVKRLGSSTFLTSPMCFPLFHSLDINRRQEWISADNIAKELCEIFAKEKHQLLMKHLPEPTTKERHYLFDDVTLQHRHGHLNFETKNENRSEDVMDYLSMIVPQPEIEPTSVVESLDMCRTPSIGSSEAHSVRSLPLDFNISLERSRNFSVVWKPSVFDEEEYRLYKKYQMAVHGDCPKYIDRSRYRRFLVETPLRYVPLNEGLPEHGLGSFHIQYRIDDRLVGVSVVDVLPRSLCSNYFFWDPDFASLQLGKISALMEIDWIRSAKNRCPRLRYYYLGYYVHSCPKTNYKMTYAPSELLCPEKHVWVTLTDEVKRCLDAQPYVVLSSLPGVQCRPNHVFISEKGSSITAQQIELPSGECLAFGDYMTKLEESAIMDTSRRQLMDGLKTILKEWRAQTLPVANQLVYYCQWTP